MFSTLEGELPRTRGPNPLFWTHTLAHLSLAFLPPPSDYLQLTLSPFSPRVPYALVVPTAAFPAFYTALRLLLSPTADTAHCPECCVVASPSVLSPPPLLALFPPVLHVQFCITIRRALRKLPRNFSLPRARDRLFQPSPPPPSLLANSELVRLTLFLSSRERAIHRGCFSSGRPSRFGIVTRRAGVLALRINIPFSRHEHISHFYIVCLY